MSAVHALDDRPLAYRLDAALRFELQGAAFKADPFPTFAALRAAGPLIPVRMPFIGRAWTATTHAACEAMVKDNGLFVQEGKNAGKSGVAGMQWWMPRTLKLLTNNMLQKDEPDHRRLRKLVDRAFARRDILGMRPHIEAVTDRILDDLPTDAPVDLVDGLSRRLPLEVISELLGLPPGRREGFAAMVRKALTVDNAVGLLIAVQGLGRAIGMMREIVAEVRAHPRPGLIAELLDAEASGDRLDEGELIAMIFLLLVAGFETTTHLITDSVLALEQHPDQKAWLLADPTQRMERAVEELARFTSPVQSTKPRYVARDAEFLGQRLRRGDLAIALLAAANADPAVFEGPEALRLDRFPNPHLVFSSGIHFCLGMQLARLETQVALSRLYARFPHLALAQPDRLDWIERFGIRGLKALPVRLAP